MANPVGRPKGSGGRAKALLAMAQKEIAKELGVNNFDPVIMMLMFAADKDNPKELRLAAAAKATPYVHSTLKAIEITGDEGGPIDINMSQSKDRLAQMVAAVSKLAVDEDDPKPVEGAEPEVVDVLVHAD